MRGRRGRGNVVHRAIRRAEFMERPRIDYGRLGATGVISVLVLAVMFVIGGLLDVRGESGAVREFVDWAARAKQKPVDALVNAARAHRFVFLADIYTSNETKRLGSAAIAAIARGPGLDAVALEVGRDLQPVIDRYLDTSPENASILLAQPRALGRIRGGGGGDDRAHVHLLRAVDGGGSGRQALRAGQGRADARRGRRRRHRLKSERASAWRRPGDDGGSDRAISRGRGARSSATSSRSRASPPACA